MSVEFNRMDETSSTVGITTPTKSDNNKLTLVIVGAALLVSLVAIIVAIVAVSRTGGNQGTRPIRNSYVKGGGRRSQQSSQNVGRSLLSYLGPGPANSFPAGQKKVWTVAIGHDYGVHEYIDESGYLSGFHHDLVRKVCQAAGADCRLIWDEYTNCWDSTAGNHAMGGKGLLGGWYDACTGWYKTVPRMHVFKFSQSFLKPLPARFWVKKGQVNAFNEDDVKNSKIGFLDGWANDEKCLYRWMKDVKNWKDTIKKENIMHYKETGQLKDAIKNNAVKFGFAGEQDLEQYKDEIEFVPSIKYNCMVDGNAMMSRKDNDFTQIWNTGFNKIIESNEFKTLCNDDKYKKGIIRCVNA